MTELNLNNTSIQEIQFLVKLTKLEVLNLSNTKIDIKTFSKFQLPSLRVLVLAGNKFGRVPENVFRISQTLSELDLSRNEITIIPQQFASLKLQKLDLSTNLLSKVDSLDCSKLRILDLAFNRFTSFPLPIDQLSNVQTIEVSGNPFSEKFNKLNTPIPNQIFCEFPVPDRIIDYVYLGSWRAAQNWVGLQRCNIRHVLIAAEELYPVFSELNYCCIKIQDEIDQDMWRSFEKAVEFIDQAVSKKECVLVHCKAGISR